MTSLPTTRVVPLNNLSFPSLYALKYLWSNPSHFVRLNVEVRADIAWWQCLLQHWNVRSFFPPLAPTSVVYSDASGSFGCGTFSLKQNTWFQLEWPETWSTIGIAAKEMLPIVIAAAIWGPGWSGEHIHFCSDNEAVVTTIQRRHARHPLQTNLLRSSLVYAILLLMLYHVTTVICYLFSSHRPAEQRSPMQFSSFFCLSHSGDHPAGSSCSLTR